MLYYTEQWRVNGTIWLYQSLSGIIGFVCVGKIFVFYADGTVTTFSSQESSKNIDGLLTISSANAILILTCFVRHVCYGSLSGRWIVDETGCLTGNESSWECCQRTATERCRIRRFIPKEDLMEKEITAILFSIPLWESVPYHIPHSARN